MEPVDTNITPSENSLRFHQCWNIGGWQCWEETCSSSINLTSTLLQAILQYVLMSQIHPGNLEDLLRYLQINWLTLISLKPKERVATVFGIVCISNSEDFVQRTRLYTAVILKDPFWHHKSSHKINTVITNQITGSHFLWLWMLCSPHWKWYQFNFRAYKTSKICMSNYQLYDSITPSLREVEWRR